MRHLAVLAAIGALLTSQLEATALHVHGTQSEDSNHHHGLAAHHHRFEIVIGTESSIRIESNDPDHDQQLVGLTSITAKTTKVTARASSTVAAVTLSRGSIGTMSVVDVRVHGPPHQTALLRAPPAFHLA